MNVSRLPSMRAEHFPYSGPYPWLDLPDAAEQIAAKERTGDITQAEAAQCRSWSRDGYIIIPKLIADEILDPVWASYERAIASGKPLIPSTQPIKMSRTPRFLSSVNTCSQNLAPSLLAAHIPNTSLLPSTLIPRAR